MGVRRLCFHRLLLIIGWHGYRIAYMSVELYDFSYKNVWRMAGLEQVVRFFIQNSAEDERNGVFCTIFRSKSCVRWCKWIKLYDFSYKIFLHMQSQV